MRARPALLLLLASVSAGAVGCKDRQRSGDSGPATVSDPGSADGAEVGRTDAGSSAGNGADTDGGSAGTNNAGAGTAAAGIALVLPAQVGPPPPFDKVRRYQKRSDVLAALGSAIREATPAEVAQFDDLRMYSPGWMVGVSDSIYSTPMAGVFARLSFSENRLDEIALVSLNAAALDAEVTTRWGSGGVVGPDAREYPASPAGWSATLTIFQPNHTIKRAIAELVLEVSEIGVAEQTPDAPGLFKMFADVGSLIGEPLTAGQRVFGEAFVIESADEDGAAAELSDARQGYADVTLPWTGSEWTTVLRVDQKTGKVVQATIDGETDEYEERVELMKQLKAAFGKPQAVITDAGYQRIGFSTKTLVVTLTDDDPHWTIEMHRR